MLVKFTFTSFSSIELHLSEKRELFFWPDEFLFTHRIELIHTDRQTDRQTDTWALASIWYLLSSITEVLITSNEINSITEKKSVTFKPKKKKKKKEKEKGGEN